jgi:hypothetical protein
VSLVKAALAGDAAATPPWVEREIGALRIDASDLGERELAALIGATATAPHGDDPQAESSDQPHAPIDQAFGLCADSGTSLRHRSRRDPKLFRYC